MKLQKGTGYFWKKKVKLAKIYQHSPSWMIYFQWFHWKMYCFSYIAHTWLFLSWASPSGQVHHSTQSLILYLGTIDSSLQSWYHCLKHSSKIWTPEYLISVDMNKYVNSLKLVIVCWTLDQSPPWMSNPNESINFFAHWVQDNCSFSVQNVTTFISRW